MRQAGCHFQRLRRQMRSLAPLPGCDRGSCGMTGGVAAPNPRLMSMNPPGSLLGIAWPVACSPPGSSFVIPKVCQTVAPGRAARPGVDVASNRRPRQGSTCARGAKMQGPFSRSVAPRTNNRGAPYRIIRRAKGAILDRLLENKVAPEKAENTGTMTTRRPPEPPRQPGEFPASRYRVQQFAFREPPCALFPIPSSPVPSP